MCVPFSYIVCSCFTFYSLIELPNLVVVAFSLTIALRQTANVSEILLFSECLFHLFQLLLLLLFVAVVNVAAVVCGTMVVIWDFKSFQCVVSVCVAGILN